MTVAEMTYEQVMKVPFIVKVVNQIKTPSSLFQRWLGRTAGDTSPGSRGASESVIGREVGWDIFDATRQFAGASAPMTPPRRVTKKRIGHVNATCMRAHESIDIYDEKVFNARNLGGQIGSIVDLQGLQYIRRQITFMVTKFRNQREWMFSRMFRGGFNMDTDGDRFTLKDYNASATDEIIVNYQIPSDNKTRMQLGTGSDILDDWGQASAAVVDQILAIDAAFERIHGRGLRHIWINSNTFANLLKNTQLRSQGGDAFTIYSALSLMPGQSLEGIAHTGFDVVFRALPLQRFHVYNGVLSADGVTDGTSTSVMSKLIPDDYGIFLPEPDDGEPWEGLIEGSEPIAENIMSQSRIATGFTQWATRCIDPPKHELKFLDNYIPVLYNPNCVGYGYVGA